MYLTAARSHGIYAKIMGGFALWTLLNQCKVKELKKLWKELKACLVELKKYEKLYKVDGITEEEQAKIDDLKRKIQEATSMVVEKKQKIESENPTKKTSKDDVKKRLKSKLETWLDDQLFVAKNAIEKSPHKQFNTNVGDNIGTAITSPNNAGIFSKLKTLLKNTFEKKVNNKYKLEDVQTAWEDSVKEVKASISTHIDKYVADLLLGLEYNSIKKKRIQIAKKGEAALSGADLKHVLYIAIKDEMDNKLPSTESLNTAFEKSFSTFFTPDPNKKEVSIKSIKTKCRTTLEGLLDKFIAVIDELDAENYSSVNTEKLKEDLKIAFEDKVSDDFYFGKMIYEAFQKDLQSNDPSIVYKHWTLRLDALKSDEGFILDIAETVCKATEEGSSVDFFGKSISISQDTLDEIESNISKLFNYLPITSSIKTIFEQNSKKKEPKITPVNPSPVDGDSITKEDIRAEFIQSLTIWCNGASGAINDVFSALSTATPQGKQAASWWQFGGSLITSVGNPLFKVGGKIAINIGNLILSTFAKQVRQAQDKNGKVSLGKVISSWRASIDEYSTNPKLQEELFELFLDAHENKTNKELWNQAKLFRGILPSKVDLKKAILGTLDLGEMGKITLDVSCALKFGNINPLKALRNSSNNMSKVKAIDVLGNFLSKKNLSKETALALMSIYGDQTNIFETGVMINANLTFTDYVRKREICKVNFAKANGNVLIGRATQDQATFKFKLSKEELNALCNKFMASARKDNSFSIAKIIA